MARPIINLCSDKCILVMLEAYVVGHSVIFFKKIDFTCPSKENNYCYIKKLFNVINIYLYLICICICNISLNWR